MDNHEIIRIEALLYEQDHRIIPVLKRFFVDRHSWEKGDPRRSASLWALLWLMLFSPAAVTVGGGVIALLTLIVLVHQNTLLREQVNQTQVQIEEQGKWQHAMQIKEAYAVIDDPTEASPLKRSAIEFLQQQRANEVRVAGDSEELPGNALRKLDLRNAFLDRVDLSDLVLTSLNLENAQFRQAIFRNTAGSHLDATGCSIATALDRVRFTNSVFNQAVIGVEDSSKGTAKSMISGVFHKCRFESTKFIYTSLEKITFDQCVFEEVKFEGVNFKFVTFLNCDISGIHVKDSEWRDAEFNKTTIMPTNVPLEFIDWVKSKGANVIQPKSR